MKHSMKEIGDALKGFSVASLTFGVFFGVIRSATHGTSFLFETFMMTIVPFVAIQLLVIPLFVIEELDYKFSKKKESKK